MIIVIAAIYIAFGLYVSYTDFVDQKDSDTFRTLKLLYWFAGFALVFLMSFTLTAYKSVVDSKEPQFEQIQEPVYRVVK